MKRTLTVVSLIGMASAAAVAAAKALLDRGAEGPVPAISLPDLDHNVCRQLNQAVDRFGESFGT